MTGPDRLGDATATPLAPLEQLWHWLLTATAETAAGLIIGTLAARAMRRRHLHWSWAAGGLGLFLAARALLGASGTVGVIASIAAMLRGRRWHREDLDIGADLARIARARRAPAQLLRRVLGDLMRRRRSGSGRASGHGNEGLVVGTDRDGQPVSIPFGGAHGGTHTLLLGATGSGKTVSQSWICVRAIEQGTGAVVIDPKGDPTLRDVLRDAAKAAGRPFIEWTPGGPSTYNPYDRGSETAIADRVLAGERFTEPHYQRQAQRYLGHEIRIMRAAGVPICLATIAEGLEPERLEQLARTLPEPEAESAHRYLDSLTPRQRLDLAGVRDRLAILAESDAGRWLDPRSRSDVCFEVLTAVRTRAAVYFNLEADARPLLAQMLGRALVLDLQAAVAALQDRPAPTVVALDEFSALGLEQVVGLFARARSAGFSLLLGTQELADLRLPGRERALEQVLGNLSAVICHRQVLPDSAALVTSLSGRRGAWRTTRHHDGGVSRTRTTEQILAPDDVLGLPAGWAAVIALGDPDGSRLAHIHSPTPS